MSTNLLSDLEGGSGLAEKGGIQDDSKYHTNVAGKHISIRMGFLRKVYGLLSVQLMVTTVVAGTFGYTPVIRDTIHSNPWLLFLCLPLYVGLFVALDFKRHEVPMNFILLGAFTVVEAITVGVAVSMYDAQAVIKATTLTLIITGGLTAYTFQTRRDFSHLRAVLFIGLVFLIGLGFLNVIVGSNNMEMMLAGGGALLFSLFIIIKSQRMMQKLSAEEYILATITLYLV